MIFTGSSLHGHIIIHCRRKEIISGGGGGGMTEKIFSSGIIFLGYKSNFRKSGQPSACYGTVITLRSQNGPSYLHGLTHALQNNEGKTISVRFSLQSFTIVSSPAAGCT